MVAAIVNMWRHDAKWSPQYVSNFGIDSSNCEGMANVSFKNETSLTLLREHTLPCNELFNISNLFRDFGFVGS